MKAKEFLKKVNVDVSTNKFKSLLIITGLLLQINVYAQTTRHVETAGTLSTLISAGEKYEITDLTLTGNLNGDDIRFIREMAGRDVNGNVTNGKLAKLNLADANIVAGGSAYYSLYSTYYTSTNMMSNRMFYECTGLTSITIPNSVTSIGGWAFYGCIGLTSVTIGNGLTTIEGSVFGGCTGLKEFIVSGQNQNYSSDGGVVFNKEKTAIMLFPPGKQGSYIIPNTVTTIGNNAFYGCFGLTDVTIGSSVTSIGSAAFYGCAGLTNITIPNSVTSIGGSTFSGCTGLTSITIPNSVTSIDASAFSGCTGLKEIVVSGQNQNYSSDGGVMFNKKKTAIILFPPGKQGSYVIPNTVTSIEGAFSGCTGLTDITIPNSVTSIGGSAFLGCTGLTGIIIPNSVTSIGGSAFAHCIGLTDVTIPNSVTSIGDSAFRDCTGLTSITIPNSITSISGWAFFGCTGLTGITIPNSVTSINGWAFAECTGLTEIHCKSFQPAALGSYIFDNVNKTTCKLYVPRGSYTAYSLAFGWRDFLNIIEEDDTAIQTINKDNASIRSISNGICIDAKETVSIAVYNLSGQTVYQKVIHGSAEIMLDKGVYIVRVNNESPKVIVK